MTAEQLAMQEEQQKQSGLGAVVIAKDVVSSIAALAASEVDGVVTYKNETAGRITKRSVANSAKIEVVDGVVSVALSLHIKYNFGVPEVTKKVQEKVKQAIENMTGYEVADVNIKVAGISVPEME